MAIDGELRADARQLAYRFSGFRLTPDRQELSFEATAVAIGGRAFDILTLLVKRAGEVVSKDALVAHTWPDYVVHEHNLKVNVGNLRRLLAAYDGSTEFIATVAGRGYKFVAPVDVVAPADTQINPVGRGRHINPPRVPMLFGRDEALVQISEQLDRPGYLTVVGPGGAGKTSVAITAARHYCGGDGRIAFVDLSTLSDPNFVVPAMASAIGVSLSLDDPIRGVIDILRHDRPLLIIDNCEHVIATTAAIVERISGELPHAPIIATSREPMRTRHENVHHLGGLTYPDSAETLSAEEALCSPAVQLFVARAGIAEPMKMTDEHARTIAAICARLEGLALAIELAAGTAGVLAPSQLARLFEDGFGAMNRGPRDAPLRHQTLQATLDWSYRLLSTNEAVLLDLLSVFSGRFSAADVEAIYGAGNLSPMAGRDALAQLVAKSLVSAGASAGDVRYRLVESTWTYAAQRLMSAPYAHEARRQFASRVRDRMQEAEREWLVQNSRVWLKKYNDQLDDLRTAICWSFGPTGDPQTGIDLVVASLPLWQELSAFKEMLAAIERASEAAQARPLSPISKAKFLTAQAWAMTLARKIHPRTGEVWRESIACAAIAKRPELELPALCGQAVYLAYSGRPLAAVRSMYEYGAAIKLDWSTAPDAMRLLAHIEVYAGRFASAASRLQALRKDWGNVEDVQRLSRFQVDLPVAIGLSQAFLTWLQGRGQEAGGMAEEAVSRATELGHMISLGNAISLAGLPVSYLNGDLDRAEELQKQLADVARRENIGFYEGTARFFDGAITMARGDHHGLEIMNRSIDELFDHQWRARVGFYRALLAEAWLNAGELDRAEESLRKVQLSIDLRQERWCHPELWRVAGLIQAKKLQTADASRLFVKSLRSAKAMGGHSAIARTEATMAFCGVEVMGANQ